MTSGGTDPTAHQDRRRTSSLVLACVAVLLALIACGAAARSGSWASGTTKTRVSDNGHVATANGPKPVTDAASPHPLRRGSGPGVTLVALIVGAFALVLVVLGLMLLADVLRLPARRRWRRQVASSAADVEADLPGDGEETLQAAVQRALREVDDQPDAREAVVRAWLLLGEAAAVAGSPRRPAESAREYARRLAERHRLPSESLERLAALYREARFSDHEVHPEQRDVARRELHALQTALADAVDLAAFR